MQAPPPAFKIWKDSYWPPSGKFLLFPITITCSSDYFWTVDHAGSEHTKLFPWHLSMPLITTEKRLRASDSSEPQQVVLDWWNCLNQLCRIENGSDFFTFQTRTTMKISDLNHQFLWIKSNQVWTQSNHGKKLVTGFKWFRLLRYFRSEPKKKSDLNSRNCGFQGQIGWFRSETPK